MVHFMGISLAPMEVFVLLPKLILPFGQDKCIKKNYAILVSSRNCGALKIKTKKISISRQELYPLSFAICSTHSPTRTLHFISESRGGPWVLHTVEEQKKKTLRESQIAALRTSHRLSNVLSCSIKKY